MVTGESPISRTDPRRVRSELKAREMVNLPVSMNRNYQYLFRVPRLHPPG